jgi:hypothetical protein
VTAPADAVVAKERAVPVISPAPLVPIADFGPVDRLQGWAMTAVVTALAALTRFLNLGSPTDAGTPIFDEKHYAPQAWQLLHNHGVEDNPGYGLVVHPPLGKQLIAIGEALFGYNGLAGGSPERCAASSSCCWSCGSGGGSAGRRWSAGSPGCCWSPTESASSRRAPPCSTGF